MADINTELEQIRKAVYGREVRGSIANAIELINKEQVNTSTAQTNLDSKFNQLIINAGNSNAEVVAARVKANGTQFNTLGKRLDKSDEVHNVLNDEVISARTDSKNVAHKNLKTRLDKFDSQLDTMPKHEDLLKLEKLVGQGVTDEQLKNAVQAKIEDGTIASLSVGINSIRTENIKKDNVTSNKISSESEINIIHDINITKGKYIVGWNTSTGEIQYADKSDQCITQVITNELTEKVEISLNLSTAGQVLALMKKDGKVLATFNKTIISTISQTSNQFKDYITYNKNTSSYTIDIAKCKKDHTELNGIVVSFMQTDYNNNICFIKTSPTKKLKWLRINKENIDNSILLKNLPKINLLDEYTCCVGKEFNLYNCQIIQSNNGSENDYLPYWTTSCPGGRMYNDRLSILATQSGNYLINLKILRINETGEIETLYDKVVKINVKENTPLNSSKKMLLIGDSRIEDGNPTDGYRCKLVTELKSMLGDNVEFLGGNGTYPNLHEGRSGWSTNDYLTKSSFKNHTNPFYNPLKSDILNNENVYFDFNYYMTSKKYTSVDCIVICLGANDNYNDNSITNINYIINNIHQFNSNIKIFIMSEYCSPYEPYSRPTDLQSRALQYSYLDKQIKGFSNKNNVTLLPTYCCVDNTYDFNKKEIEICQRNTDKIKVYEDTTHVNSIGYCKISDVIYSYII